MLGIATSILIVFLALVPASAAAQERVGFILPTGRQVAGALDTEAMRASARLAQAQPTVRRDSLKNGAIIGLIVGAASPGTFAWLLTRTDAACGCEGGILKGAALGAGIGAGIGAGVDALFERRSLPNVRRGMELTFTF